MTARSVLDNRSRSGSRVQMQVKPREAHHWSDFTRAARGGNTRRGGGTASEQGVSAEAGGAAAAAAYAAAAYERDLVREGEAFELLELGERDAWVFQIERVYLVDANWFRHWQQWCLDRTRDDRPGPIRTSVLQERPGVAAPGMEYLVHYNAVPERVWKVLERRHGCIGGPIVRHQAGQAALYEGDAAATQIVPGRASARRAFATTFALDAPLCFSDSCRMALDNLLVGLCAPLAVLFAPYILSRAYGASMRPSRATAAARRLGRLGRHCPPPPPWSPLSRMVGR